MWEIDFKALLIYPKSVITFVEGNEHITYLPIYQKFLEHLFHLKQAKIFLNIWIWNKHMADVPLSNTVSPRFMTVSTERCFKVTNAL